MAERATGRLARCPRCGALFAICRACDRGYVYCGPRCSRGARRDSLHRARQRHRQSVEGRLDHRDRERARRQRRREARRVGDHPFATAASSARLPAFTVEGPAHEPIASPPPLVGATLHCVACRRRLRFAAPEPTPPLRRVAAPP